MKLFIMCIGLPASGKSTAIDKLRLKFSAFSLISSDNYIIHIAETMGLTYDEAFTGAIKGAEGYMNIVLEDALAHTTNMIVWDQTNLTPKTRKKKLAKIPKDYTKIAWYFEKPVDEEWHRRLDRRPGKTIPKHILKSMAETMVPPNLSEGFDAVLKISPNQHGHGINFTGDVDILFDLDILGITDLEFYK